MGVLKPRINADERGCVERPILFNSEMVRAILSGKKTQTRRPVTHELASPPYYFTGHTEKSLGYPASEGHMWFELSYSGNEGSTSFIRSPWGVGDLLWVRETWAHLPRYAYARSVGVDQTIDPNDFDMAAVYKADWERSAPSRWKPSIHMPRWASRIKLRVKRVWVERIQDVDSNAALAEGVAESSAWKPKEVDENPKPSHEWAEPYYDDYYFWCNYPPLAFGNLWDSIYGNPKEGKPDYSTKANPQVWCCEFERVEG